MPITLAAGENRKRGHILGKITIGAITAVGAVDTAGDGDFVTESVSAGTGAQAGVYTIVALSATLAQVFAPDGGYLGLHTIGVAWDANGIEFNTEGTWAMGDSATVTVSIAAGSGQYKGYASTGADGTQLPVAILAADCNATAGAEPTIAYVFGNFHAAGLLWNSAGDVTAGTALLNASGQIFVK